MLSTFQYPKFEYVRPPEIAEGREGHYPVVIVGAGPVGLTAAIDLAQQGQRVLLLDNDDTVSIGSRGVCYAKRTLEVLDRLGCAEEMVQKGVSWNVGKVFYRDDLVYSFNLLPESGHRRPAFVNLQQYYVEGYLLDRALELPNIDIRWSSWSRVNGMQVSSRRRARRRCHPASEFRRTASRFATFHRAICALARSVFSAYQRRLAILAWSRLVSRQAFPAERAGRGSIA